MRVAVFGGAGYIGGALTDILGNYDHEVVVYDNLLYEDTYRKPVDFVMGDVRDHEKLQPWLDWADVVVWLAAIVGDPACALRPTVTEDVNVKSVQYLADNFDGRIIFMSTCSVYGAQDGLLDEASPTNPLSLYADTKLRAEAILKDKNALIFRLGTLFGLGDNYSRPRLDLVVNTLVAKAMIEGKIEVFGGDQYRPLLHVYDVASTIAENIDTDYTGIYNLHSENIKIIDLANQVVEATGAEIAVTNTTFQDSRNYRVSSDKARNEIEFKPMATVADGIAELIQLFSTWRLRDIYNHRYYNHKYLEKKWN